MGKIKRLGLAALILLVVAGIGFAQGEKGRLAIVGVPEDRAVGRYDPEEGVFYADVREIPEAQIQVEMDGVRLSGRELEWRTKDNYLLLREAVHLERDDFELTADLVEYFGDQDRLTALGSVVVVMEDATIYCQQLVYDEEVDQAVFTGQVRVEFGDGVLVGEKFVMLMGKSELQFFGAFQGEFDLDSN